jgi:hypothetical protein
MIGRTPRGLSDRIVKLEAGRKQTHGTLESLSINSKRGRCCCQSRRRSAICL